MWFRRAPFTSAQADRYRRTWLRRGLVLFACVAVVTIVATCALARSESVAQDIFAVTGLWMLAGYTWAVVRRRWRRVHRVAT